MQAAHADLSHVRDCPDSTPEPVVQHEVEPQYRSYLSSLAAQTDVSPGHAEDPLPDVRIDASFEHSNQDDNIGDRLPLPVICSSYTHVEQTEQNQAVFIDNPFTDLEAEEPSSKHIYEIEEPPSKQIYGTEVDNTESVVQYELRGACHKEALSNFYQCGRDVEDASTDRQDVEVCGANGEAENISHDEVQTETVVQQLEGIESSEQNRTESEVVSEDECIRPYAVAHDQYGHRRTNDEQGDVFDIQPYAVTYDQDNGHCGIQTPTDGNGLLPNPMYSGNALLPNPMYSGNALPLNPAYVPNVRQPQAGGGKGPDEVKQTKSAVGGKGHEAGMLPELCDVVVSPSNEVYMSDASNRVVVLGPRGLKLRSFPATASETECETKAPEDAYVSIGGRGHLWDIGNCNPPAAGLTVQYTKMTHDIRTLHPFLPVNTFLGIAADALVDRVVRSTFFSDYLEVAVRTKNGTVVREFRMRKGFRMQQGWGDGYPGLVTVGRGGNLTVADHWALHVYAYNGTGHHLLSFEDGDITEIIAIFRMCIIKCIFPHY
uniref:Uncharacterized protein n=1 Tax=Branchiostoma floridae TaxID=7739 RepID=C3YRV8_BRAFL|eukprot:XP_002600851.1 hypothetical protein BRAFLDRAFT_75856 [Branchiostoma floridae]